MSDWMFFPGRNPAQSAMARRPTGAVRVWLWIMAGLVLAMVVVGGATRLTESGLSITEWRPVTGVLPPLNAAEWQAEFEKYQKIPQYSQLFPDMDLAHFQFIYFWEWGHRLLGRLLGVAMLLPLVFFWAAGRLSLALGLQLLGVLALGGLQGFVGWWMVQSGLTGRVEVSQYRLAVHLLLASLTFAALVWIASGLERPARQAGAARLRGGASLLAALVFLQIGLGALVAGLRAGLVYNTWPWMDGRFIPPLEHLTSLSPLWLNLFENVTTVQLQHRLTAYLAVAAALALAVSAHRLGGAAARRAWALAALAFGQAALGVATLVLGVPLWAGLAHQASALILLGAAVRHRRALG